MMDGKTPYVGFGNDTLAKLPKAKAGLMVECPHCGKDHPLEAAKDTEGNPSGLLMFFSCGGKQYLGAVAGKLVANVRSDCSGHI